MTKTSQDENERLAMLLWPPETYRKIVEAGELYVWKTEEERHQFFADMMRVELGGPLKRDETMKSPEDGAA